MRIQITLRVDLMTDHLIRRVLAVSKDIATRDQCAAQIDLRNELNRRAAKDSKR